MAGRPRSRAERVAAEDREQAALARDARDRELLLDLGKLVADWMDQIIPHVRDLESPRRRWSPIDLVEDLREARTSIQAELTRISGPTLIDDDGGQ